MLNILDIYWLAASQSCSGITVLPYPAIEFDRSIDVLHTVQPVLVGGKTRQTERPTERLEWVGINLDSGAERRVEQIGTAAVTQLRRNA
jgi:hypothetical protein